MKLSSTILIAAALAAIALAAPVPLYPRTLEQFHSFERGDESLTSLAVYFRNWHMFRKDMNNIPC